MRTSEGPGEQQRIHEGFASALLEHSRRLTVHLPPDYESEPARCYPVMYLHDGQNLFEDSRAAFGVSWRAGETADRLAREGRIRPVILVGIDNTPARQEEYAEYRDPLRQAGGQGELYGRFVMEEVKPFIDRHYRTLPGRAHTAVAGSSLGGLVSLTMAMRFHERFGLCACCRRRCGGHGVECWWT
jgi:enterochelin esterase-like enzyme